jgi:hypothetical protein
VKTQQGKVVSCAPSFLWLIGWLPALGISTLGCSKKQAAPPESSAVLTSGTFRMTLPAGWKRLDVKDPQYAGPHGEIVQVSSFSEKGEPSTPIPEIDKIETQKSFMDSMSETAANHKLIVVVPLKSENLANGSTFQEIGYKSTDGKKTLCGFSAIWMRTAVFVTYDSRSEDDSSIALVREAVRSIEWIQSKG